MVWLLHELGPLLSTTAQLAILEMHDLGGFLSQVQKSSKLRMTHNGPLVHEPDSRCTAMEFKKKNNDPAQMAGRGWNRKGDNQVFSIELIARRTEGDRGSGPGPEQWVTWGRPNKTFKLHYMWSTSVNMLHRKLHSSHFVYLIRLKQH